MNQRDPARLHVLNSVLEYQVPIAQAAELLGVSQRHALHLLAVWYAEQQEPWVILTDLPPAEVGVSWYTLRFWIELGFKAVKSLGWKWDKTRRTDPARVSRHWLVLSVATLLTLAYGTRVEEPIS